MFQTMMNETTCSGGEGTGESFYVNVTDDSMVNCDEKKWEGRQRVGSCDSTNGSGVIK